MLFSSIVFICFFLPIVIGGYFLIPSKYKNLYLFIASLIFYIWGEKLYVLLMLSTITVNYFCSMIIEKGYKKQGVLIAIIFSLGSLFFFKYATFTYTNIVELFNYFNVNHAYLAVPQVVLPLGISFYTFQVLSYTIDVYRGTVRASKSFLNFATYVTLFPHLIAGPIVRYAHVESQLLKKDLTAERMAQGIERFIWGLAKKIFIANNCAVVADRIFDMSPDFYSPGAAWIAAIAYTLQIFFDFSAYSDMAIGLAKIFGFDFHENFNYPYTASSVKDFWRRWHISLSTWFRDYLYIPLGGSRSSKARTYLNLFIVFLATGLWHGASWNFVFWGLWHGMFLVIERIGWGKLVDRLWAPVRNMYTMMVIVIGWVFFRANDFGSAIDFLQRMFFINTGTEDIVYYAFSLFSLQFVIAGFVAIAFSFPIFPIFRSKLLLFVGRHSSLMLFYYLFLLGILVCAIITLSVGTYNPFIYFRF